MQLKSVSGGDGRETLSFDFLPTLKDESFVRKLRLISDEDVHVSDVDSANKPFVNSTQIMACD